MNNEYYGRGCKDPYQYIVHDDGTVTENYFGEVRVLGKVGNPEILEEVKKDDSSLETEEIDADALRGLLSKEIDNDQHITEAE